MINLVTGELYELAFDNGTVKAFYVSSKDGVHTFEELFDGGIYRVYPSSKCVVNLVEDK